MDRLKIAGALVAVLTAVAMRAHAQDFPQRPIRIVVGAGTDVLARLVGQKFTEAWGQQVVIDPRPAGGGMLAAEVAARATADGHTLLLGSATYTINTVLQPKAVNVPRDFAAVVFCASTPLVLVVHAAFGGTNLRELVTLAKARPGKIDYASGGSGTPPHLAGEMLKLMAAIDLVHVPYKGAAPAMIDVVGGQVPITFANVGVAQPHLQAGRVRALAVSSARRSAVLPDLPTVAEAGYPGFEVIGWNGFLVPRATPVALIQKLNAATLRALDDREVRKRLAAGGWDLADANTPQQFAQFMQSEIDRYARLVKDAGLKVE